MNILTEQWIQQLKEGDDQPYTDWVHEQYAPVVLFAFQMGLTLEGAEKLSIHVLRKVRKLVLENEENDYNVYRVAIELLQSKAINVEVEANANAFLFPEDEQLHNNIIQLPFDQKLCYVLYYLHDLSNVQIASISNYSEETVQNLIQEAIDHLQLQKPMKQLALIKKSYERLATKLHPPQQIVETEEKTNEPLLKEEPRFSRKQWIWIASSITALVVILCSTYFMSDDYALKSSIKLIDQMEAEFEEEIARKYELVGLQEKMVVDRGYPDGIFNQLTRQEFRFFIRKLRKQVEEEQPIERKEVKKQYEQYLEEFQLPSEMVDDLFRNPLSLDPVKSEQFINDYYQKLKVIQQVYYDVLFQHYHLFQNVESTEEFQSKLSTFPEEVQQIIAHMPSQNFDVNVLGESLIEIVYTDGEEKEKIQAAIHESIWPLFQFISEGNMTYYRDLPDPNEVVERIDYYEDLLVNTQFDSELIYEIQAYYTILLSNFIVATEYDSNMQMIPEHREAWGKFMAKEDSPAVIVLQPLIDDFLENDWRKSEIIDSDSFYFAPHYEALEAARNGLLNQFAKNMSQWHINPYNQQQGELNTYHFDDPEFMREIERIYEEVNDHHHWDSLRHVSPALIYGLYHYANTLENAELVWKLIDEGGRPPKESFMNSYKSEKYDVEHVQSIEVDGNHRINNQPAAVIMFTIDHQQHYGAWLIWNEADEMWYVQSVDTQLQ